MARLSEFATDTETAEGGKWCTLRPKTETAAALRVRIRSAHSKPFRRTEQKLQKKFRGQFVAGSGFLDTEGQDEYDTQLCVDGVVTDWEGMEADDGTPIPFARMTALRILSEFPQLRREIFAWARSDENFKPAETVKAEQEAIVGNL